MKKTIFFIMLLSYVLTAQHSLLWQYVCQPGNSASAKSITLLSDGNLLLSGFSIDSDETTASFFAAKISKTGTTIWQKKWHNSNSEYCCSAIELSDHSLFFAGTSSSGGQSVFALKKTDAYGNIAWEKNLDGTGRNICKSSCATSDGNILLCGYTNSSGSGENDILLVKITPNGTVIWQRTYGGTSTDLGSAVLEFSDGFYYVAGTSGSFTSANKDALLIKIDTAGNEVWHKNYNRDNFDSGVQLTPLNNNGFLLTGSSDYHGGDLMDISVWQLNATGSQRWYKYYDCSGYYDYGVTACTTADMGAVICGNSKAAGETRNFIRVLKIDSTGKKQWEYNISSQKMEWINSAVITNDSTLFIAGQTRFNNNSQPCAVVYKINLKTITPVEKRNINRKEFLLFPNYPNPFNPETTISYSIPSLDKVSIRIFNLRGDLIECLRDEFECAGPHSIRWNGARHSSGIYFVELLANTGRAVRPVMLLK